LKKLIGILFIALGILGGLYVGGWMMFIQPIISACKAFDIGELTGMIVGVTILKCIFASAVGSFIVWAGITIGILIYNKD